MEIILKVVLSADADLLAALQALTGQKSESIVSVFNGEEIARELANPGTITTTEKKTRKAKEQIEIAKAEIPNASDKEMESIVTEHTLDSLRAIAVPLSKAGHKDAIKAKLTALGYENGLASLQPKDFQNFFDYLQTLS